MGLFKMGIPENLALNLQKQYDISTFVETGTYMGGTSVWASDHFEKVITIENSAPIFERTSNKYKHIKNIDFLYGNSKDHLEKIVSNLDRIAIFWLDAHWCTGETYGIDDECPILEEIKIINSANINHIILIDDARLFVKPPPLPHKAEHWANITQIILLANEVKDRYCFIAEDVIGVVPNDALQHLAPYFAEAASFEQKLFNIIAYYNLSFIGKIKNNFGEIVKRIGSIFK